MMVERAGLIIILAYLLVNIPHFQRLLEKRQRWSSKVQLIIIFSLFAVISNFSGVEIMGNEIIVGRVITQLGPGSSLANTRVLTIGVSGLIGGPAVGFLVGTFSAIIRLWQGGLDPFIYVASSLFIGLFSGLYGKQFIKKKKFPNEKEGAIAGLMMEVVQMVCILTLGSNLQDSMGLVSFIVLPMVLTNSFGTALFLSIINSSRRQRNQAKAVQTHDVLELANKTLPYFRSGLDEKSSQKAASIIKDLIQVDAVSITDQENVLAHVGAASDHHKAGREIYTDLTREVIETEEIKEVHSHEEIGCPNPDCPLEAAVIIPLYTKEKVLGTLKLYFTNEEDLTFVEKQLAEGLGNIFSTQIELGQAETESRLLQDAEIKSLQAQVNPHFFFNSLNTIGALIRVDSEKARELIVQLSHFFRVNLQGTRNNLIQLSKELQQVKAYVELEQARFPGRVEMILEVEGSLERVLVPPFLIQVLVENAYKHAFQGRKTENKMIVSVFEDQEEIVVQVKDNGYGIPSEKLADLGNKIVFSKNGTGSALENLNKRLITLFGKEAKLNFNSNNHGTTVMCRFPRRTEED